MITDTSIAYPDYDDLVTGSCRLIVAVHSNMEQDCQAFVLKTPPSVPPRPLAHFVWAPFNRPEHAILYAHGDPLFNLYAVNDNGLPPLRVSQISKNAKASFPQGVKFMYHLHHAQDNPNILVGAFALHLTPQTTQISLAINLGLNAPMTGIHTCKRLCRLSLPPVFA
jgi:hypothetical protein